MSILQAQIVIPNDNGIARDAATNTLHFGTTGPDVDEAAADEIVSAIGTAWSTADGGGLSIIKCLATSMNPAAGRIKVYRLNDATPRAPIADTAVDFGSPGAGALPSEVALVANFQAVKLSGVPQARRRNRIFLGPLTPSMSFLEADGVRPAATYRTAVLTGLQRLKDASDAAVDWSWIIYSPTLGLLNGSSPVDNAWVSNKFDVQRRRGLAATARTSEVLE